MAKHRLRKRYGHAQSEQAKFLSEANLRVRKMPGGYWAVFSARGVPHMYHTNFRTRTDAAAWAISLARGRATSPYGTPYRHPKAG